MRNVSYCRWCDKECVFWNERWSHTNKRDQTECPDPLPFEDDQNLIAKREFLIAVLDLGIHKR